MKFAALVLVVLIPAITIGQKRDAAPSKRAGSSHSVSSDAVATALKKNSGASSSAQELSRIEHQTAKPQSHTAAAPHNTTTHSPSTNLGTNKPIRGTYKTRAH
jgi:hypothetical protein